jgi:hypothetical protein
MKPTKTVKPAKTAQKLSKKITKAQYHTIVAPAFVAWRKEMHAQCGVTTRDYCRLFTERRANGARTKYWYSYNDLPENKIKKYIKINPTFIAGGKTFKIVFNPEYITGGAGYPGRTIQSATLHAEKLKPIKFN